MLLTERQSAVMAVLYNIITFISSQFQHFNPQVHSNDIIPPGKYNIHVSKERALGPLAYANQMSFETTDRYWLRVKTHVNRDGDTALRIFYISLLPIYIGPK